MRVMLVTHSLAMGGSERVVTWLSAALAARGHEVSLLVMSPASTDFYPCDKKVRIVRTTDVRQACTSNRWLRMAKSFIRSVGLGWVRIFLYARIGKKVRQLAELHQVDVVISLGTSMNLLVLLGLAGSSTAVVVSERSGALKADGLGFIQRRLRTKLYREAHALVVLGSDAADRAQNDWGVTRAAVIPNAAPVVARDETPLAERPRTVLCVGRLQDVKDHALLLRSWARSRASGAGWRLQIVGDGPMRTKLEALVRRMPNSHSVSLLPTSSEVMNSYAAAQLFVLPSKSEGFPNALLEAMAHGCACVATECSAAVRDLLADGKAGVLVPPGDESAIVRSLDELTSDADRRFEFGLEAKQRSGIYSEDRVIALWEKVLGESVEFCGKQQASVHPRTVT